LDDGLWLASADMPSHGLGNMRRRAEQLGGKLLINRTPTGSSVELSLPALMSHGSTFERAREYGPRED
jgi:signal transduction histidine kinase